MAIARNVLATPEAVAAAAADIICETACSSVKDKGYFTLVLSGGRTPNLLYDLLATAKYADALPWEQMLFFWGDERYVPPSHKDSNYRSANERLFSKLPIPPANIYPMGVDLPDASQAARLYERELRAIFRERRCSGFDLTLLGMGADGHTASLFPASPALVDKENWVAATAGPGGQLRLTLTIPLINASDTVLFLVTGAEKKAMLTAVMTEIKQGTAEYPAAMVRGRNRTVWLVDQAACPAADNDT